jgi:hypothetical protein
MRPLPRLHAAGFDHEHTDIVALSIIIIILTGRSTMCGASGINKRSKKSHTTYKEVKSGTAREQAAPLRDYAHPADLLLQAIARSLLD